MQIFITRTGRAGSVLPPAVHAAGEQGFSETS